MLTIHIGVSKTGSSAIQDFLGHNSHWLRERGIVFPDENMQDSSEAAGQHVWYFEQSNSEPEQRAARLAASLQRLLAAPDVRQVVISAENLSNNDSGAFRWFKDVARQTETEVIVYLRRQDDFLLSSWQQWYAKVEPDFWAWLTSCVGLMGDWRVVLKRWENIVGRDRIHVRLYERDKLVGGDAVGDFAQFLKVDEALPTAASGQVVNPSFNAAIVALLPGSGLFEDGHDDEFFRFLEEMLGPACYKRSNESPITLEQRVAIIKRYDDCNLWIRERYFPESNLPPALFEQPSRQEYEVPSERQLEREQIQLLMRLVFELRRRQDEEREP